MPPREWRFRIQDILDAIESIRTYTEGSDFTIFERDKRTVDAVAGSSSTSAASTY